MTPNQVRARLAKRARRCGHPQHEPSTPPLIACVGWRIIDTSRGTTRIVACEECNALAPARLKVTDAQVRALSEAVTEANRREQELRRARENKNTTRHLRADFEETYPVDQNTLCGHPIGRSPKGKRRHIFSWRDEPATARGITLCEKCIELAALTPWQRLAREIAADVIKQGKLKTLKGRKQVEREAARAARLAVIEAARPDAMVLLDAIEAGRELDADMAAHALTTAIDAHVMAGGAAGKRRLWLTDGIPNECNCARLGRHGSDCPADRPPTRVNLICRFCREVLAANVPMGSAFVNDAGRAHAQHCALTYLAGAMVPQPHGETAETVVLTDPTNESTGKIGAICVVKERQ